MKIAKLPLMNQLMTIALRTNTDVLLKELSRFDYPSFNQKPVNGGWSAGEIAEHLLLFDIRVNTVLSSHSVPTTRDAQEKINAFQERLADRENRIDAPPFLVPSDVAKDPDSLIEKIIAERRKLERVIVDTDLYLEYPDTPHRLFGVLTGIEWIQLLIHHCNRHLIQLGSV
jgi:hypothetical protein